MHGMFSLMLKAAVVKGKKGSVPLLVVFEVEHVQVTTTIVANLDPTSRSGSTTSYSTIASLTRRTSSGTSEHGPAGGSTAALRPFDFDIASHHDIQVTCWVYGLAEDGQREALMATFHFTVKSKNPDVVKSITVAKKDVELSLVCVFSKTVSLKTTKPLSIERFSVLKEIGKGHYGKVLLASNRDSSCLYAIKAVKKCRFKTERGNSKTHQNAFNTCIGVITYEFTLMHA
jgi:hypothetical protein